MTTLPSLSTSRRVARLLLVSMILTARSGAQDCSTDFSDGNLVCLPDGSQSDYGEMIAGDLNGDLIPEVVLLRGTRLTIAHGAAVANDAVVVADDATAVCYAGDAAGSGAPGLFYCSSEGVHRVVFEQDEYAVSDVLTATEGWANAVELHADPVDGLLGVDSTRHVVLRSGITFGVPDEPVALFSLVATVRNMLLMNWDGGQSVIALQSSYGLHIRRQEGPSPVIYFRAASLPNDPYDCIAVTHHEGVPDVLCWVTRAGSAPIASNLYLYSGGFSPIWQGPRSLNGETYDSASAGDFDADGEDELVLADRTSNDVHVVTLTDPIVVESVTLWAGTPTVPNSHVLGADLFNDRYTPPESTERARSAIAMVIGDLGALRLMPRGVDEEAFGQLFHDDDFEAVHCDPVSVCTEDGRLWTIDIGTGWGTIGTATHMQITTRHSLYGSDVAAPESVTQYFALSNNNTELATVSFTSTDPVGTRYFAVVRPVIWNGQQVTQAWRASILSMSADCAGENWLEALPGSFENDMQCIDFFCTYTFGNNCAANCPPPFGSRYVPSAVPQSRIPSAGPGILPGDPPN